MGQQARIQAEDLFEVKVEIFRVMSGLDPEGDWLGRGARASTCWNEAFLNSWSIDALPLSADIDFIYKDLMEDLQFSMSRYRLAVIQQKRVSGLYVLSPLQLKFIKKEDLTPFLYDTLPDCPDIMLGTGSDPDMIYVVMPEKEDVKPLVGDGSVYKLISSFLFLPIIDDDGKNRGNDEVIFDDKAGYALLEELSLAGKIVSIGPGDDPLPCYGKILFLDTDSKTTLELELIPSRSAYPSFMSLGVNELSQIFLSHRDRMLKVNLLHHRERKGIDCLLVTSSHEALGRKQFSHWELRSLPLRRIRNNTSMTRELERQLYWHATYTGTRTLSKAKSTSYTLELLRIGNEADSHHYHKTSDQLMPWVMKGTKLRMSEVRDRPMSEMKDERPAPCHKALCPEPLRLVLSDVKAESKPKGITAVVDRQGSFLILTVLTTFPMNARHLGPVKRDIFQACKQGILRLANMQKSGISALFRNRIRSSCYRIPFDD
ncbi:hypothetical protein L484_017935 [Morus notabilis]|uniref:DUF8018 domain-containing protein n=1 Tax=Morus notabilis TaxID=981085 RepID=W9RQC6_9ROSA|nr:hypothetical protein L484_017935 [Morus notabilis]